MLFDERGPAGAYEELLAVQDRASRLQAVVVLHRTAKGPALLPVARTRSLIEREAVAMAMQLAARTTARCALAELPFGGGAAVLLEEVGSDARAMHLALGRALARHRDRAIAAPGEGTGARELAWLREAGAAASPGEADGPAATVAGLLSGARGALRFATGSDALAGRRVLVHGLDPLGRRLAAALESFRAR